MPDERFWEEFRAMSANFARLEERQKEFVTHRHVQETVAPIQMSIQRIESAVLSTSRQQEGLFTAHKDLLRQQAERDKLEEAMKLKAAESKTMASQAKKIGAYVGIGVSIYGGAQLVQQVISSWLKAHGF